MRKTLSGRIRATGVERGRRISGPDTACSAEEARRRLGQDDGRSRHPGHLHTQNVGPWPLAPTCRFRQAARLFRLFVGSQLFRLSGIIARTDGQPPSSGACRHEFFHSRRCLPTRITDLRDHRGWSIPQAHPLLWNSAIRGKRITTKVFDLVAENRLGGDSLLLRRRWRRRRTVFSFKVVFQH